MNIHKAKYNCLKTMTNDLMKAEYFINNIGIETRCGKADDESRPIIDVLKDIVQVCNGNPTILDDCAFFLKTNPSTSDEQEEFLSHYKFDK